MPNSAENQPNLENIAKKLLAECRHGVLSTHSNAAEGYPFGSRVPYALDQQGRVIILISQLAQHTQNIQANKRVSLTLWQTTHEQQDIQQQPRLVYLADAEPLPEDEENAFSLYFQAYPDTQDYYQNLDFEFYRLKPIKLHLVVGFAQVKWLDTDLLSNKKSN
ncbi:MAG: pyridoxamine 5'-phosphate oxidase family protein [Gammaproteobacteria bacterium]|nr:pyridoxamine 5'-phosphate oxidase family protein [Gammaproteobacteria bacterium]